MDKITIKAKKECKVDTIIITISKKLTTLNDDWERKDGFKRLMSWRVGNLYLYKKKSHY